MTDREFDVSPDPDDTAEERAAREQIREAAHAARNVRRVTYLTENGLRIAAVVPLMVVDMPHAVVRDVTP